MFDRSYHALVDGDVFPTGNGDSDKPLPATKDKEIREQMVNVVGVKWTEFKGYIDVILNPDATQLQLDEALRNIIAKNVPLLKEMHKAVGMYDKAATARNAATSQLITIAAVVALILMAATAVLIYLINQALSKAGQESEEAQAANQELQMNIVDLLEVVSEAAEGDLQVRAQVSEGALGNVADAVNQMIESWSKVLQETTTVADDMEQNLQFILASSQDVADDAERQSSRIVQTNELMSSLVEELNTVQDSANSASVAADQTRNSAEEGSQSIQLVIQAMQQLQANVQEGAKKSKDWATVAWKLRISCRLSQKFLSKPTCWHSMLQLKPREPVKKVEASQLLLTKCSVWPNKQQKQPRKSVNSYALFKRTRVPVSGQLTNKA